MVDPQPKTVRQSFRLCKFFILILGLVLHIIQENKAHNHAAYKKNLDGLKATYGYTKQSYKEQIGEKKKKLWVAQCNQRFAMNTLS